MELIKKLGFDINLLDNNDIEELKSLEGKINLPNNGRPDPNKILSAIRNAGVDIDRIIKKMRGNVEPKKSMRIKRNDRCKCGSGKKYKKCCLNNIKTS